MAGTPCDVAKAAGAPWDKQVTQSTEFGSDGCWTRNSTEEVATDAEAADNSSLAAANLRFLESAVRNLNPALATEEEDYVDEKSLIGTYMDALFWLNPALDADFEAVTSAPTQPPCADAGSANYLDAFALWFNPALDDTCKREAIADGSLVNFYLEAVVDTFPAVTLDEVSEGGSDTSLLSNYVAAANRAAAVLNPLFTPVA